MIWKGWLHYLNSTGVNMNKLPDKPSELIVVALNDLKKCEADNRYDVRMSAWHQPGFIYAADRKSKLPVCFVCLAGAAMAQTLQSGIRKDLVPTKFDNDTANKLRALNYFSQGCIYVALSAMDIKADYKLLLYQQVTVTEYNYDKPRVFHKEMKGIIKILKGINL